MSRTVRATPTGRPLRRRRVLRYVLAGAGAVLVLLLAHTLVFPGFVLAKASVVEYAACRGFAAGDATAAAPRVIAHRGYLPDAAVAENSVASIEAALAAGYTAIEIDVNFTRDLVPVLFHDQTLERLTARSGALGGLSWDELQAVPLRDGQPVLRLADFWRQYAPRFELVCVDVKAGAGPAAARAQALSEALPARPNMPRVIVIGVSYATLKATARLRPELSYACETFGAVANWLAGFDAVSASYDKFSPGQARLARALGLTYVVWTLNKPDQVASVAAAGADAYMTDRFPPTAK